MSYGHSPVPQASAARHSPLSYDTKMTLASTFSDDSVLNTPFSLSNGGAAPPTPFPDPQGFIIPDDFVTSNCVVPPDERVTLSYDELIRRVDAARQPQRDKLRQQMGPLYTERYTRITDLDKSTFAHDQPDHPWHKGTTAHKGKQKKENGGASRKEIARESPQVASKQQRAKKADSDGKIQGERDGYYTDEEVAFLSQLNNMFKGLERKDMPKDQFLVDEFNARFEGRVLRFKDANGKRVLTEPRPKRTKSAITSFVRRNKLWGDIKAGRNWGRNNRPGPKMGSTMKTRTRGQKL